MPTVVLIIFGFFLGLFVGGVVPVMERHFKSSHYEPIQNRAEYDKCYKEFGETK